MPLVHYDDAFNESLLDGVQFWMEDEDERTPVLVNIERAAIDDFMSLNDITGTRRAAFALHRDVFYALASASFDLFGAGDEGITIKTSEIGAFPAVQKQFPDIRLK